MASSNRRGENQKPIYMRHSFALGAMTSLVVGVLIWLLSDKLQLDSLRDSIYEAIPTVGTLIVAVLSLFMSLSALEEQRRVRQASTDPVVLVHFGKREDAPSLVTLEISNVGAGAAQNVSVKLDPNVVKLLLEQDRIITDFRETTHPIRVIPQDRSISYNFGQGFALVVEPFTPPIRVDLTYEDIDGRQYAATQWLDVRELKWQRADKLPDARAATSLEKLAKEVEKLTSKSRKQHVIVQTAEEYRKEEEERHARLREAVQKQQKEA